MNPTLHLEIVGSRGKVHMWPPSIGRRGRPRAFRNALRAFRNALERFIPILGLLYPPPKESRAPTTPPGSRSAPGSAAASAPATSATCSAVSLGFAPSAGEGSTYSQNVY